MSGYEEITSMDIENVSWGAVWARPNGACLLMVGLDNRSNESLGQCGETETEAESFHRF